MADIGKQLALSLLAASTAFSLLGFLYASIPIGFLFFVSRTVSGSWSGAVRPLLAGGVTSVAAIIAVVCTADRLPHSLIDRHFTISVNLAATMGAVLGILTFAAIRRRFRGATIEGE